MKGGTRLAVFALLVVTLAALVAAVAIAATGWLADRGALLPMVLIALAVVGCGAAWIAHGLLDAHFNALERLRVALVAIAGTPPETGFIPPRDIAESKSEAAELAMAIAALAGRRREDAARPDARLVAVIGAAGEAIVAVNANYQVSLINAAARAMFGPERVGVGRSLFGALHRRRTVEAVEAARASGGTVQARVKTTDGVSYIARVAILPGGGAVLAFPPGETATALQAIEHDLSLHDIPAASAALGPGTLLEALPATVLDCETTGLDVTHDRIVSIGAVRTQGARILRRMTLDTLVNPGRPIPPRSTSIHGITDATVADAPRFAEVAPGIAQALGGTVMVGHNAGFDSAMLRREAQRAGVAWQDPPTLCTMQLAGALFPRLKDLNLETVAARLGAATTGRHTALGDALVTAEVFTRLIPLLREAGVRDLAGLQAFAGRARHVIAMQRQAGW